MKTIFIGSYKTIEECYRVIFAKITGFKSQIFSQIYFKIGVYILYVPLLINYISFIKIGPVVLAYQQFKVLKSRQYTSILEI